MKSLVKIITAVLLVLIPITNSQAFHGELNGFKNLYWGESLQEIQRDYKNTKYIKYDHSEDSVEYLISMDSSQSNLGGVNIGTTTNVNGQKIAIPYLIVWLWNDQLFRIGIWSLDYSQESADDRFTKLFNMLNSKFGKPDQLDERGTQISWYGGNHVGLALCKDGYYSGIFFTRIILSDFDLMRKAREDAASAGW